MQESGVTRLWEVARFGFLLPRNLIKTCVCVHVSGVSVCVSLCMSGRLCVCMYVCMPGCLCVVDATAQSEAESCSFV